MGHNGLALAISLAAMANFVLQIAYLRKKIGLLGLKSLLLPHAKMLAAALVMAAVLWGLLRIPVRPIIGVSYVAVGAILYLVVARLLGCTEWHELVALVRKKQG